MGAAQGSEVQANAWVMICSATDSATLILLLICSGMLIDYLVWIFVTPFDTVLVLIDDYMFWIFIDLHCKMAFWNSEFSSDEYMIFLPGTKGE